MANVLEQLISGLTPEKRAVLAELLRPAPESIAIIGMGCRFPGGSSSPEAFWQLLRQGRDGIIDVPPDRWDGDAYYDPNPDSPNKMYTRWAGFLPDIAMFDASFFGISPAEAIRMDPQQRLLLEVTWEALEHAGLVVEKLARSLTGVFIGIISGDYPTLQRNAGGLEWLNDPYYGTGSSSSMASGRIAYLFDFQGPSIALDTACSSSLVTIHLACQSLRNKECDLALAGGVNAVLLPEVMVNVCKMRMLSGDGRCKTFDAAADGFAVGEGCGIVVLKRLSDALRDGDPIAAVIRGSAVNEDGRSTSLTAPNGLSQQAVIRRALAQAGVAPHQVSYVEAHGSGTPLGDPIEIEALATVFGKGRPREQPLLVGTVKTNIGHLAAGAGVAGVIKTTLALGNKAIPAHLNLRQPNPGIAWEEYPVAVATALTPWVADQGPRIAGVSSFGWSGTNAHVVIEEPPAPAPTSPARPYQLLLLSAKTAPALETMAANLAAHLAAHPELDLADVAYTLQTGRQLHAHRRALVCRDRAAALAALRQPDPTMTLGHGRGASAPPVAFLFPGVGDHYVGMAQELYASEPTFRATIERCCAILQPLLGQDLRNVLFEDRPTTNDQPPTTNGQPDLRAMLGRNGTGGHTGPLQQTAVAQPALFVVEYALAQLLMQWGVKPAALLGYSLGEYVAACLAGVLTLEDALTLVARRAQLIQALPAGAMLTVMLAEDAVQPHLGDGVELAVVNSPSTCVLAGPPDAIAAVERRLLADEVACRRVETTHAFHTAMLAPVAAELTELARGLTLSPPQTPYLSNVTGTWITAAQATDPAYWARHMCQTVRFADGVGALLASEGQLLLEVGPGAALGSFARQHPACTRERMALVLSTLPGAQERGSDRAAALTALGKLWLLGAPIDWASFYAGERRRRVVLPSYPFQRQRFWWDGTASTIATAATHARATDGSLSSLLTLDREAFADWFYAPAWRSSVPLLPAAGQLAAARQCWLIFEDDCGVGARIARWLSEQGQDVIAVQPGDGFVQLDEARYSLGPRDRADYDALLRDLHERGRQPTQIIHLWTVTDAPPAAPLDGGLAQILDLGFYSLLSLAQALGDLALERCAITVVSNDLHSVTGQERLCAEKATIIGPCRIIPFEYAALRCRCVDIALAAPGSRAEHALFEHLLGELGADSPDAIVALRGDRRWVQSFEALKLDEPGAPPLRERGAYLITGGLGGIGLAMAEHLARSVHARLALVGRGALPPRDEWPRLLAEQGEASELGHKIRRLQGLEALGAEVLALQADVADPAQIQAAVAQAVARFGALNGVIHAAGVPGVGLISLKIQEAAAAVLAPKVLGTLALDRALEGQQLDFLALFSSIVSLTGGGAGQLDYCAANAFLDAYAQQHHHRHGRTIAIGWGEWEWNAWEHAMSGYDEQIQQIFRDMRQKFGIRFDEGAAAFSRALARRLPHVFVSPQNLRLMIEVGERLSAASLVSASQQERQVFPRPTLGVSYVAPRNKLEETIAAIWSEELRLTEVGINDNFFDLGGNSLMGLSLLAKLRRQLGVEQIPSYVLYEAPSVSAMAKFFEQDHMKSKNVDERLDRGAKRRDRQAQRRRG